MKTKQQIEREFLDDMWEDLSGKRFKTPEKVIPYPELYKKYWNLWIKILPLMVNRMVMGHMRYGDIDKLVVGDYLYRESAKTRLDWFNVDGNLEHFIDAANIILKRFYIGQKAGEKFIATDESQHNAYRRK